MKKLTVLFMVGLFVLISPNTESIAGNENNIKKCNDGIDNDRDGAIDDADPDCQDIIGEDPSGGGGGSRRDTYSLTFSVTLPGNSGTDRYTKFSANAVGFNTFQGTQTTTIDLSDFAHLDANHGAVSAKETCFGGGVGHTAPHTFRPFDIAFIQGKHGTAEAGVWFEAQTANGVGAVYLLHAFGYFKSLPSGWPPKRVGENAILRMTRWEMVLNNGQPNLVDPCLFSGEWSEENEEWQIDVGLE